MIVSQSLHTLTLPSGEKVEYMRTLRQFGTCLIGSSILAKRFPPDLIASLRSKDRRQESLQQSGRQRKPA